MGDFSDENRQALEEEEELRQLLKVEEEARREREKVTRSVARFNFIQKFISRAEAIAVIQILITFAVSSYSFDFIKPYLSFFVGLITQFWVNLVGVLLIALVGGGLYYLREKKRTLYGAIEVGFSLAYGWYSIDKVSSVGYVETISVIAAIYLVVRGLDNIMQGLQPKDEKVEKK